MNKVILIGRLTKDPEARYTQGNPSTAITTYSLAVDRSYKKEGEPEADFINIVTFGKAAEFSAKYFRKGLRVAVEGELRISSYTDKDGNKKWSTNVVVNRQYFADGKQAESTSAFPPAPQNSYPSPTDNAGFMPIDDAIEGDEDLPF